MTRAVALILALAAQILPADAAGSKDADCGHQAAVVAAVQQARLDRIRERKVPQYVSARATWPARYNTAIPLVTPWVYEMRMRDVRNSDLAAAWKEMCLAR